MKIIFFAFLLAFALIPFFIWFKTLQDLLSRTFENSSEKIAWLLGLIFLPFISVVLYYFFVKNKENNNTSYRPYSQGEFV